MFNIDKRLNKLLTCFTAGDSLGGPFQCQALTLPQKLRNSGAIFLDDYVSKRWHSGILKLARGLFSV